MFRERKFSKVKASSRCYREQLPHKRKTLECLFRTVFCVSAFSSMNMKLRNNYHNGAFCDTYDEGKKRSTIHLQTWKILSRLYCAIMNCENICFFMKNWALAERAKENNFQFHSQIMLFVVATIIYPPLQSGEKGWKNIKCLLFIVLLLLPETVSWTKQFSFPSVCVEVEELSRRNGAPVEGVKEC